MLLSVRPFRTSHHAISDTGKVGGGTVAWPGQISLAHNGVKLWSTPTTELLGLFLPGDGQEACGAGDVSAGKAVAVFFVDAWLRR